MDVGGFIQEQVLGMRWLDDSVGWMLSASGVDTSTQLGGSLQFFIYDLLKIIMLLVVLIYVVSYIQTYYPPERTKSILGRIKGIRGNAAGALLGTVTPFCSCSSIPVFIGFTKAGLPLGVTFSFLISSPLVDFAALAILIGLFGFEVAVLYVVTGIVIAIAGGMIIERMGMEDQIADFARADGTGCGCVEAKAWYELTRRERSRDAWTQVRFTLRKVFPYAVAGVLIGALIHNWIPTDIIQTVLGENNPFSVIFATLLGAPVYADIFGTIPIAEALYAKGIEIGTILAFMMSVTIMSIPSLVLLRTVIKGKLMAVFISVCLAGVMITGYLFDAVF